MKFEPKKWVSLVLGKVYVNYPKTKEKCSFTKPTLKRVIITGNHLFGPVIKEERNLDQKKGEFCFGQSVRNLPENYEKRVLFRNLLRRE